MTTPLAHLVDDDDAIRDALAWQLKTRGLPSCGYPSAEHFLEAWTPDMAGCIVLDMRMSGMTGLDCFDQLCARDSRLPVIFLTGHGDVPMAVGALKKGAFDFFEKPVNDNDLIERIEEALAHDQAQRAAHAMENSVKDRLMTLTSREREIMTHILAGKYNKVIADELSISMRTVEVHRANLFDKMQVKTAVELANLLKPAG
jgi:two-component system response regulator DctR